MKKLMQKLLLLCLVLSFVHCSDKNDELPPITTPLRPITPGVPPIRPRIIQYPTVKFSAESKQMSFTIPENNEYMRVCITASDGMSIDTIVTTEKHSIALNHGNGPYTISAMTEDSVEFVGKINL